LRWPALSGLRLSLIDSIYTGRRTAFNEKKIGLPEANLEQVELKGAEPEQAGIRLIVRPLGSRLAS
jgi:hypothetical protein